MDRDRGNHKTVCHDIRWFLTIWNSLNVVGVGYNVVLQDVLNQSIQHIGIQNCLHPRNSMTKRASRVLSFRIVLKEIDQYLGNQ